MGSNGTEPSTGRSTGTGGGRSKTFTELIHQAIVVLDTRGGSSFLAIKKYIAVEHAIDVEKSMVHIRRAMMKLLDNGTLVQTSGTGLNGSFKLKTEKTRRRVKVVAPESPKQEVNKRKTTKGAPPAVKKTRKVKPVAALEIHEAISDDDGPSTSASVSAQAAPAPAPKKRTKVQVQKQKESPPPPRPPVSLITSDARSRRRDKPTSTAAATTEMPKSILVTKKPRQKSFSRSPARVAVPAKKSRRAPPTVAAPSTAAAATTVEETPKNQIGSSKVARKVIVSKASKPPKLRASESGRIAKRRSELVQAGVGRSLIDMIPRKNLKSKIMQFAM